MRKILLALLLLLPFAMMARTTYIPHYYSMISVTRNGKTVNVTDTLRELSLGTPNDKVVFTVLHEEVTKSKVKSIKRAKSQAGWSVFANSLALGLSMTDSQMMINYQEARESEEANQRNIEDKKSLSLDIMIENNSDETIFISDMALGTKSIYIPAQSYVTIRVSNPIDTQLRVSNIYVLDPKPKYTEEHTSYVTIHASSYLTKEDVSYEDDDIWAINQYVEDAAGTRQLQYVKCIDKETREETRMLPEDFNKYKKSVKKEEKK